MTSKVVIDGNTFTIIKSVLKHTNQNDDIIGVEVGEDERGYGYISFLRKSKEAKA